MEKKLDQVKREPDLPRTGIQLKYGVFREDPIGKVIFG